MVCRGEDFLAGQHVLLIPSAGKQLILGHCVILHPKLLLRLLFIELLEHTKLSRLFLLVENKQ